MKQLIILGLGHVGSKFNEKFSSEYFILASNTTGHNGHTKYQLGDKTEFIKRDQVVLSTIPWQRFINNDNEFLKNISPLLQKLIETQSHFILLSSVGIYERGDNINEDDEIISYQTRSSQLKTMEKVFQEHLSNIAILRLGGIVDEQRHPGKFLAGRKDLPEANLSTNLVHTDDIVSAIDFVIKNKLKGIFNLCAPIKYKKVDFYTRAALKLNLSPPHFAPSSSPEKNVSSQKIIDAGFTFQHPDLAKTFEL